MPGIYIFEDEKQQALYIGKSISIRSRIKQHFEGYQNGTTKAQNFIPQTKYLYIKRVKNDTEAVIVEANFIKSLQPRYNAITKDDKSNLYIVFTNLPETKLRLVYASEIDDLNLNDFQKQIYGPYTSATTCRNLLKQIRKIFGYCLSPFNYQKRACFYYHLGNCPGACVGKVSTKNYLSHIGKIKKFLSGKFVLIRQTLQKEIKRAIKKTDFEAAQTLKNQIEALDRALDTHHSSGLLKLSDANISTQQKIVTTLNHPKLHQTPIRIECFDLAHHQGQNYVGAMSVFINASAHPSEYRRFHVKLPDHSDPYAMRQIISRRLTHFEWGQPDLIVLDGGIPQLSIVLPVIPTKIPVIALAKKRETIYFYDQNHQVVSLNLNIENPVLNLFRNLRDEAHHLANSFHQKEKRKNMVS